MDLCISMHRALWNRSCDDLEVVLFLRWLVTCFVLYLGRQNRLSGQHKWLAGQQNQLSGHCNRLSGYQKSLS